MVGQNYLRALFALGFQGFLIMICVGIYAVLIQSISVSDDIIGSIWGILGWRASPITATPSRAFRSTSARAATRHTTAQSRVLRPDTVWFDPCLEDPEDYETLELTDPFGMLQKQLEVAENLAARSHGDYLVSMPDNCVAIDALAHLRGSEDLLCDMLTDPDAVLAASARLIEGWKQTTKAFHEAIGRHQDGNCIGWLTTYAPGLHAQVQCDLGAMISRELVEKFFLNELREACRFLEYSLYHLDGIEQKRFLDLILSVPELKMIQWTSVDGQPPALESLESLRAIQAAGKGLLLNLPAVYVKDVLECLSPKGLYIVTTAPDEDAARELVRLAERR